MKIKMDSVKNKKYYDELIFVNRNLLKITKNPSRNVICETQQLKRYIMICIVLILFVECFTSTTTLKYFVLGIWILYLVLLSVAFVSIKIKINKFVKLNDKNGEVLEFNDKSITLKTDAMTASMKIDELKNVVYNKYTIVFLNKNIRGLSLIVSREYQKEVEEILLKYKLDDLIIE